MSKPSREDALASIRANIQAHGQHVYLISSGPSPRYAYTIGLSDVSQHELIFAGGAFYSAAQVGAVLNRLGSQVRAGLPDLSQPIDCGDLGHFRLQAVDPSWTPLMLLGAFDHYGRTDVGALQVLPPEAGWTADIPDMTQARGRLGDPVWRWLDEPWTLPVAETSMATTNLDALRCEPVTEAARWEDDLWELFAGAGPDVPKEAVRTVPLATLLGLDPGLAAVVTLPVGAALWREAGDSEWHVWE